MKNLRIKKCISLILVVMFLVVGCSGGRHDKESEKVSYDTSPTENYRTYPEKKEEAKASEADSFEYEYGEPEFNTEEYSHIDEIGFRNPKNTPLSTFSIDVDTASYSNARRFITDGMMPPEDSVRVEEFINYFSYDYEQPKGEEPFSINVEIGKAPWSENHKLAMVGLKGKEIKVENRPSSNLVFLIDVSGSMNDYDKLPLLKSAFKLLVEELDENDRVSIVVYASAEGVVLDSVSGENKTQILKALDNLEAGGGTAGSEGIELAYKVAEKNFIKEGNNRIILATDGDFNLGVTSEGGLTRLIEEKREAGVFLSVLGFGTGNYSDTTGETLADKGNGNYSYIDNIREAEKVLVKEMSSTLYTIAKDVKLQIEFNPNKVEGYRLIGYENRALADEDFNDDTKDAGELGSGHTVTAFYEIIPKGINEKVEDVDDLKYQDEKEKTESKEGIESEYMHVKLRYKEPDEDTSKKLELAVDEKFETNDNSKDFMFASSVAEFAMLLRNSEYKGEASYESVIERAKNYKGDDREGYRSEFIKLVETVRLMNK